MALHQETINADQGATEAGDPFAPTDKHLQSVHTCADLKPIFDCFQEKSKVQCFKEVAQEILEENETRSKAGTMLIISLMQNAHMSRNTVKEKKTIRKILKYGDDILLRIITMVETVGASVC